MRHEIFGPILPVLSYRNLDDAIARDQLAGPAAGAVSLQRRQRAASRRSSRNTLSGGVTVNDTLLHFGAHDLPFGGIGPSGIGAIHGRTGFDTFSKLLPVFRQRRFAGSDLLKPPYSGKIDAMVRWLAK